MKANKKLFLISLVILLGAILGIIVLILKNNVTNFLGNMQSWTDFTVTLDFTVKKNFTAGSYFPFAYVIMSILEKLSFGNYRMIYLITFIICTAIIIWLTISLLKNSIKNKLELFYETLIMILLPFSMIFEFARGNIEIIVFVFCLLFYYFYKKEKYMVAAIVLALAVSMKLYPALFALLFLHKKRYKEFIICTLMSIGIGGLSYLLMIDILGTIPEYIDKFSGFVNTFSKSLAGLKYNHSILFGIYFLANNLFGIKYQELVTGPIINIYTPVIIIIALILMAYVFFKNIEEWKKVTILTLMMVIFPHTSFDYTLIALTIPMIAFIIDDNTKKWENIAYSILFGLLIIPMNFYEEIYREFIIYRGFVEVNLNIGLILRPLIACIIILTIIISSKNNYRMIEAKKE